MENIFSNYGIEIVVGMIISFFLSHIFWLHQKRIRKLMMLIRFPFKPEIPYPTYKIFLKLEP